MADLTWKWKYCISALLLVFFSCRKPEQLLPAKTQEGRNTTGYFVNGDLLGGAFGGRDDRFTFTDSTVEIIIDERLTDEFHSLRWDYGMLSINLSRTDLNFEVNTIDYSIINPKDKWESVYRIDSSQTNFVEVTYTNLEKRILSGEFEFHFLSDYTLFFEDTIYEAGITVDSISITRGRFDLKELE